MARRPVLGKIVDEKGKRQGFGFGGSPTVAMVMVGVGVGSCKAVTTMEGGGCSGEVVLLFPGEEQQRVIAGAVEVEVVEVLLPSLDASGVT